MLRPYLMIPHNISVCPRPFILWLLRQVSPWGTLIIPVRLDFFAHSCLLHSWERRYFLCAADSVPFILPPLQPAWISWAPSLVSITLSRSALFAHAHNHPLWCACSSFLVSLVSGWICAVQLAMWAGGWCKYPSGITLSDTSLASLCSSFSSLCAMFCTPEVLMNTPVPSIPNPMFLMSTPEFFMSSALGYTVTSA